jgi:signal peptidase I
MTAASRAARISALAALLLAAVWFLWPSGLGGGTTYVGTQGVSMEPRFHTGDLAILRSAGSYSVGDVVAYRSESLDTIVMHRIVAGDAGGFVTQGDNNDWLDQDRPAADEILGTLLVRIPQGGKALSAVTSPGPLVLAAGAALTLLGAVRRPRRGRHTPRVVRRRSAPSFSMPARARARQVALSSGAVALLAAVGGGVLLALPATQTDTRTLQVTQDGEFTYTGQAAPGTTYPTGVISTGDTVWTRLARQLTVSFTNTVTGTEVSGLAGSMRLDVVVTAGDGWSAVVDSGPVVALQDGTATAAVAVDPDHAMALLSRHYSEIGSSGGGAKLTVSPVAETTGTVRGREFTAGSPAGLEFALDAASLKLAGDPTTVLTASTPTPVLVDEVVPRTFTVLALSVPIDIVRMAAAAVLGVSLIVLAAGAWIGRSGRGDVADQFLVRHADRIVPVASFDPGPTVIDVSDAESLHRVAERFDTLVLHHAGEDEDVFVVRDVDATYRYVIPGMPDRQRGKPPVPAPATARPAEPADLTAPMPVVVPGPPPVPLPVNAALWGRFA